MCIKRMPVYYSLGKSRETILIPFNIAEYKFKITNYFCNFSIKSIYVKIMWKKKKNSATLGNEEIGWNIARQLKFYQLTAI